jgi:hypothetical protein
MKFWTATITICRNPPFEKKQLIPAIQLLLASYPGLPVDGKQQENYNG